MDIASDSTLAPPRRSSTLAWAIGLLLATIAFLVVGLGVYVFLRAGDVGRTLRVARSENATFKLQRTSGDSRVMIEWSVDVSPETGRELAEILEGSTALTPGEWVVGLRWPPIEYVEPMGLYYPDPYPEDAALVIDDPASGKSDQYSLALVAPRYAHVSDGTKRYRVLDSKKRRLFELLQPLIENSKNDEQEFVLQP